ncbi:MAG: DEAD/DEAH box helicase, partial [Bacteroidota bacterium]
MYNFKIYGIRESLADTIIEDINDLFINLNGLLSNEELPLKILTSRRDVPSVSVSYNLNHIESNYSIKTCDERNQECFDLVLTDRKINYSSLGKIDEIVINERYIQTFLFHSPEQEVAMKYFLQNIFRKEQFRPGQLAIINRAIQGYDVIGLLPTGGGKSLTYQICSLLHPGVTIIVDPINSLMKDQFDKLIQNGITKTNFINSFKSKDERESITKELINSKHLLLFVSPERFQIEKFRQSLSSCFQNHVYFSYAVIDEAHCVSEWGHDFRHTYLKLAQNLRIFCRPVSNKICFFGLTATASFDVLADVQRELNLENDAIVSLPPESIDREELNFEIIKITDNILPDQKYWKRENDLSKFKYPLIKKIIHD